MAAPSGKVATPLVLDVERFTQARCREMALLNEAIKAAGTGKDDAGGLNSQTQPRHMRRRTNSYNSRRYPARLRKQADAAAAVIIIPAGAAVSKRPAAGAGSGKGDANGSGGGSSGGSAVGAPRRKRRRQRALMESRWLHGRESAHDTAIAAAGAAPAMEAATGASAAGVEVAAVAGVAPQQQLLQQPQQRLLWLETHVWHAKRGAMAKQRSAPAPVTARSKGSESAAANTAAHQVPSTDASAASAAPVVVAGTEADAAAAQAVVECMAIADVGAAEAAAAAAAAAAAEAAVPGAGWGYALPARYQRGPRALASAVAAHCTVRDASHFKALQLRGAAAAVAAALARMCDPARRCELTQPCHLSGRTRGMLLLHHPGKFPERCIGPVEYLWSPGAQKPTDAAEPRLLWLWAHPAAHAELAAALRSSADSGAGSGGSGGSSGGRFEVEVGAGADCPQLVRLELRGRGAAAAAGRALAPHVQGGGGGAHDAGGYAAAARVNGAVWRGLTDGAAAHVQQLQPGTVLALTVLDPRELRFGPGGQSSCPTGVGGDDPAPAPMQSAGEGERSACTPLQRLKESRGVIASSPLWDPAVRQFATAAIAAAPDHVLNVRAARQRGWQAAPPAAAAPAAEAAAAAAAAAAMLCAPVLTIKCGAPLHPGGSGGRGSGSGLAKGEDVVFKGLSDEAAAQQGWDIIAPAGWGAPLWGALVHAGARPVGEEEVEQLHVEAAMPIFPRDYPETAAGEAFWAGHAAAACAAAQRTRAHHLGRLADPSSHRPNFKMILGVERQRGGSDADSNNGDGNDDDDADAMDVDALPAAQCHTAQPLPPHTAPFAVIRSRLYAAPFGPAPPPPPRRERRHAAAEVGSAWESAAARRGGAAPPPPLLAMPTLLPVRIVLSKGVPIAGARVYAASHAHYDLWEAAQQRGQRWPGCACAPPACGGTSAIDAKDSGSEASAADDFGAVTRTGRRRSNSGGGSGDGGGSGAVNSVLGEPIGAVTSGGYAHGCGVGVALALCEAQAVAHAARVAQARHCRRRRALVLVRSPCSSVARPGLLEIVFT